MTNTAEKPNDTKTADNPSDLGFIVFGIDHDQKPRAARFDASQSKLVVKAAELMQLKVCAVRSPELANLAKRLPVGRLYATGGGFVPPVQRALYANLTATMAANGMNPASEGGPPGLPSTWDKIDVGHLVIANEGAAEGWWEAIVVEVNDDMLTLHWRDYPWEKNVVQHRSTVALLKPTQ